MATRSLRSRRKQRLGELAESDGGGRARRIPAERSQQLFSDDDDYDVRDVTPSHTRHNSTNSADVSDHDDDDSGSGYSDNGAANDEPAEGGTAHDLVRFLANDIFQGYEMDCEMSEVTETRAIRAFQVPWQLEKFVLLGTALCLNCFLDFATYLPLRAAYALATLPLAAARLHKPPPGVVRDLLRCALIVLSSYLHLKHVDVSQAYHWIRGELQSIIKLYVLFNVFDIVDKLFCSFGQDILDTLFYHASYKSHGLRWGLKGALYFAFATAYVCIHSWINLMQFVILNVAVNSANNALLTIVISNQFVELKGSVFKRSGQGNLFQISCSDVRERFHFFCLLVLVFVRNMVAKRWAWDYFYDTLLPAIVMVYFSEVVVDNAKHVFVTRFNNLEPSIYARFSKVLWKDITDSSSQGLSLKVVRRMGFTPIPLLSLFFVVLSTVVSIGGERGIGWPFVGAVFLALLVVKVALGVALRRSVVGRSGPHGDRLALRRGSRAESPPASAEYDVRFPMEKPTGVLEGGGGKKDVPLEEVQRFTMMNRVA